MPDDPCWSPRRNHVVGSVAGYDGTPAWQTGGSALCCNNGTGGNKDTISNLEIAASSNMAKLFGVDSIPADIFSGLYVILDMRTRTASPA